MSKKNEAKKKKKFVIYYCLGEVQLIELLK